MVAMITLRLTPEQQKAVRKLAALNSKVSANELAFNLVNSALKSKFKYEFVGEKTHKSLGERWDNAAQFLGADKMPQTRDAFIKAQMVESKDLFDELERVKFEEPKVVATEPEKK